MWHTWGRQNIYLELMGKSEGRRSFGRQDIGKRVICSGSFLGSLVMRYDKYILMGLKGQYLRLGGGWN